MNFKELESAEKLRGGYYTPRPIAKFLCRWALEGGARTLLEPSCGDGVFLSALESVAKDRASPEDLVVDAVELHMEEARKAAAHLAGLREKGVEARIHTGDFFSWLDSVPLKKKWDAIIGNPPYIRYQYFDKCQRDIARRIFQKASVPFTKRTNAWVPFVIGAVAHLAPAGRMAMVIPAEIPFIQHADGLRRLLEQEMDFIRLVYFRNIVFEGTLQGTILLLGIKRSNRSFQPLHQRSRDQNLFADSVERSLDFKMLDIVDIGDLQALESDGSIEPSGNGKQSYGGHWMLSLLTEKEYELTRGICSRKEIKVLKEIASVDIGIVTGANKYFCVDQATVQEFDFSSIASPMLAKSQLMRGAVYTAQDHEENVKDGRAVFFLRFPKEPIEKLPLKMAEYIKLGEREVLHQRYKCRIRDPWYVVPYVWISEVAMLKRCHQYPRLVLNEFGAYSTDTAYRLRLMPGYEASARDLVFCFLNSLTFLFAELGGRHYAGGVLELVPSEIEPLPIPLIEATQDQFRIVDEMIRARCDMEELLDFTDHIILRKGLGLSQKSIKDIRACHRRVQSRRLRKNEVE